MEVINREMSWLLFNERVLQEAEDDTVPLLQRLRFLGIFSNNQDEFVKVRVANLLRMESIRGIKNIKTVEGFPVKVISETINERIKTTDASFTGTYNKILREMEHHHIYIRNEKQLTVKQKNFCRDYFSREISPLIVPLLVRKSTKIPFLSDEYIYHAVKMESCQNKHDKYAIIRIPVTKNCPRFIVLPSIKSKKEIIFIDDIIRLCLKEIFFMFKCDSLSAYTFKLIRDANLTVDDDITKSLMEKMEEGLTGRLHGNPVRLVYDREMPCDLLSILTTKLKLDSSKIQPGGRYHMLKHLTDFPEIDPYLEYENHPPLRHPDIPPFSSIFRVIDQQDIFLNFPYHTFDHVIDLLREAAIDPKVSRICITLYRTAERSKIINVLINAAENGKEVLVVEELMARFDEEKKYGKFGPDAKSRYKSDPRDQRLKSAQ